VAGSTAFPSGACQNGLRRSRFSVARPVAEHPTQRGERPVQPWPDLAKRLELDNRGVGAA